ncbi:MAG: outer membrane protein assembly factor BamD [Candidatus Acidiferrum sp.]
MSCATSKLGATNVGVAACLLGAMLLAGATTSNAQIFHKKKKVDKSTSADNNAQPDKILYDRAVDDMKHGRQEVGRLNMQTLINTYPDSEYLAKAKLAIADSYYKEGGTSNLALAVSGYKDFEVFFPFLPEATYAQMQVAMAHYRQMEKPDRDRTQALDAEEEFQIFLQKYPNDPLAPQARQHLREVQEILAEGDYRIGYYYYVKGDKRAAATRLLTVTSRYPLYSKSDRAIWMMGDIFEKSEHKEIAARYYARIVKEYPLSPTVPDAKAKLKELGAPIPQPDPTALAWMTKEQNTPRPHTSLIKRPLGLVNNGPKAELRAAATNGEPNMEPETNSTPGSELLTPGGLTKTGRPTTGIVATVSPGGGGGTGTAESTSGSDGSAPTGNEGGATVGSVGGPPEGAPGASEAPAVAPAAATPSTTPAATPANAPAGAPTNATPTPAPADAKPDAANSEPAASGSEVKSDAATTSADKSASGQQNGASSADSKDDSKKESSSKKKKGLRKLVPW